MSGGPAGTRTGRALPPRLDAFSLAAVDDPYPTYAALRAAAPLCRGGPGQWLVTRHAEVAALLREPRLGAFRFAEAHRLLGTERPPASLGDGPAAVFTDRIMVARDGADHDRLRGMFDGPYRRRAEPVLARMDGAAEEAVDPLVGRGAVDAVRDLASVLPLRVLGEIVGFARSEERPLGGDLLLLTRIFAAVVPEADRRAADAAVTRLRARVRGWLRDGPAADGLAADVAAALGPPGGRGQADADEAVDNLVFLLFAGFETSLTLLAGACALLSRERDAWERLRADPALAPVAVEEVLRYDAPTQITGRIVREPLDVAGRTVKPGRTLLLLIGSANRDERQFPDAARLDVGRRPNSHLSFGAGVHHCLGARLARTGSAAGLGVLSCRCERLRPAGRPARERGATMRAYVRVPLRFEPG